MQIEKDRFLKCLNVWSEDLIKGLSPSARRKEIKFARVNSKSRLFNYF